MTPQKTSFAERATALAELGFSSQEIADAELLADRLRRAGWTAEAQQRALQRMRQRNAALNEAQVFFTEGERVEELVRMLVAADPPPWRAIAVVTWAIVAARFSRLRSRYV